jgi:hypothetical protein
MNAVAARAFGGEARVLVTRDAKGVGSMRVPASVIKLIIKGGVASPTLQILMSGVFKDHCPVRVVEGDDDLRLNGTLSADLLGTEPKQAKATQEEDDRGRGTKTADPSPSDFR